MKVLVVTNLYPPHALGGYELSCFDAVEAWRANGHQVTVVTTTTTFHDAAADPPEPGVHRVLQWYWADHRAFRPSPVQRYRIERANHAHLAGLLEAIQPDVVSIWAMGAMSLGLIDACVRRNLPMAAVVGDDWLVYGARADAWIGGWASRPKWLRSRAARVTGLPTEAPTLPAAAPVAFASEFLQQRANVHATVGFRHGVVVPPGTDATDFPTRRPGDLTWRGRLLMVGRVEPRKGFDVAITALAELPAEITLRIVGAADERHRDELVALARALGVADRIAVDGLIPRDQLAAVYAEADALLFLSRWDEPFGLVPLEAMTQATPVIATRRGGAAEFLTDGLNCREVPVDDPAAVAAAVRGLAADEGLRRRLVNGGLTTGAAYRSDRYAAELEELHRAAAAGE